MSTEKGANIILAIDDDKDVLNALKHFLTAAGFEVHTAPGARKGLQELTRITPHLILLDMRMSGGSGAGFLKEITKPDRTLKYPVLVLTAFSSMSCLFDAGDVDGFMLKPFNGEKLLAEINRILAIHAADGKKTMPMAAVHGRKVLIAEDDEDSCRALMHAFNEAGYLADGVVDSSDVVARAIAMEPDVIVAKEIMSEMNGSTLVTVLRTVPKTSRTPVVIYTEDPTPTMTTAADLRKLGANDVVHGLHVINVVNAVKTILG